MTEVVVLDNPDQFNESKAYNGVNEFAAGYIGYYVCNGAVIMHKFGDATRDAEAKTKLEKAYPGRVVE